MKTSLRRLRGFASLHKHDAKYRTILLPLAQFDELAQATQDMEDMRDCYDTLLSAAAATANSAYEFSESLREMGACLLEKTALNDDEDSGKVLLMLGKLQFELQRLVDSYRSHIFQTITIPSESLLNELRIVEEMKLQCDEKRKEYEKKITERSKSSKGGTISSKELQVAYEEYEEEATLFIFRLKSLKQGQSRSLLTQAARHHASQLSFFRKALKSLETVEPHVKMVTEQQHIDYQFSGLEDNDNDNESDDESEDDSCDDELSFDYGQNEQGGQDVDSTTVTNSMELDQVGLTFPLATTVEAIKENIDKTHESVFPLSGEIRASSQSAPLFTEKKMDLAERSRQLRPSSTRKLYTYVLPTPSDTKHSLSTVGTGDPYTPTRETSPNPVKNIHNLWHPSPLEPKKNDTLFGNDRSSGPITYKSQSVLKESNTNITSSTGGGLPPPLTEEGLLLSTQPDRHTYSDTKKIKRQAFSGPLTSKPWSTTKPNVSISGPLSLDEKNHQVSGFLQASNPSVPLSSPPKISPTASPTFLSPPKISELHELPRPPGRYVKHVGLVGHSAPLVYRGGGGGGVSIAASPLPIPPPHAVTRSFSIPASSPRGVKAIYTSKNSAMADNVVGSPPLTPIFLSTVHRETKLKD